MEIIESLITLSLWEIWATNLDIASQSCNNSVILYLFFMHRRDLIPDTAKHSYSNVYSDLRCFSQSCLDCICEISRFNFDVYIWDQHRMKTSRYEHSVDIEIHSNGNQLWVDFSRSCWQNRWRGGKTQTPRSRNVFFPAKPYPGIWALAAIVCSRLRYCR